MFELNAHDSGSSGKARRTSSARLLALAGVTLAIFACTRSPGTSTTSVTSGTYDVETGACMCRLPQDEFLTCCRSGMELTCRCNPNGACFMAPTGRTCGTTPPTKLP